MLASSSTLPARDRLDWVDAGRGIAIVLVVLMHLHALHGVWFYYATAPEYRLYSQVVNDFVVLRMPLFFLLSGLLASSTLRRPWSVVARKRIVPLTWVFVLWTGLTALYEVGRAALIGDSVAPAFVDVLELLVWPRTTLWYLYALILFAIVVRLTRAAPAWIVVGLGAVATIASPLLHEAGVAANVLGALLYFVIGARLPDVVHGRARNVVVGLGALAACIGVEVLRAAMPHGAALLVVASLLAVLAAVSLLPYVASWRVLRPIRAIGRRTMPIFLVHPLLIIALNDVFQQLRPQWPVAIAATPMLSVGFSLVASIAIIATAIGVYALARRLGARWLFEPPRWLVRERTTI